MEPFDPNRTPELRSRPGWEVLVEEKSARSEVIRKVRLRRARLRLQVIALGIALVVLGAIPFVWFGRLVQTHPAANMGFWLGWAIVFAGMLLLTLAGFNKYGKAIEPLDTNIE